MVTNLNQRVTLGAGQIDILAGVDLVVEAGETLAILGSSGSGKTTLLSLLAGLDRPTDGSVMVDGIAIDALDEDARAQLRGAYFGFVFQTFQLLPAYTALENVMLPLELKGSPRAREEARAALAEVGLAGRLHHYPRQLSGGEQQRVALARAFAPRPRILCADEPTGNLDEHTGQAVADLMFRLNREHGTTLVLVTHDRLLAARCARTLRLAEGRLWPIAD